MSDYGCGDRPGEAAAYALGALDPGEVGAFLAHAESCVVCRDELREYSQIAGVIGLAVPQYEAPRSLRRAVVGQVRREARARRSQAADPAAAGQRTPQRQGARRQPRQGSRRAAAVFGVGRRPGVAWGLAGGLVAAALAIVAVIGLTSSGAPAVHTVRAQVRVAGASAELRVSSDHADLVVRHLPQPDPGHIYEVWLERHGVAHPTGTLFSPTASGNGIEAVAGDLRSVSAVMVTEEPDGGTRVPTTTPIIEALLG